MKVKDKAKMISQAAGIDRAACWSHEYFQLDTRVDGVYQQLEQPEFIAVTAMVLILCGFNGTLWILGKRAEQRKPGSKSWFRQLPNVERNPNEVSQHV